MPDPVPAPAPELKPKHEPIDRRLLWLYLFVIFAFVLLAIRTQVNDHHIKQTQQLSNQRYEKILATSYQGCLAGNIRTEQYNHSQDTLAELERIHVAPRDPALAQERIAIYMTAKRPLADCAFLKPPPLSPH